jgi:3,4-dihydroxy-2-butanone 4-phosphate synthase
VGGLQVQNGHTELSMTLAKLARIIFIFIKPQAL